MNMEEVFAAVVLALAGGSGIVGLAMTYLRRYIDRKLEAGEEEAAREVLAKYMRHKEGTRENYVRAFRHLMSRGFSADVAKDALASLGAEEEEG